jgi:hypothetical protein
MTQYRMRYANLKEFQEVGEQLKTLFSKNSPAKLEYIIIFSDIAQVICDVHQNK